MSVARGIRALLRREEIEAEMDAEMRLHIELETEELVRDGVHPEEARRRAAIAFGGVERAKDAARDERRFAWLANARRDLRIATRTLLRQRTFAITATLALALAIAVNTTMFSLLDAMVNPNIGIAHPERLYTLKYFGDPRAKVDFEERERAFRASVKLHDASTEWFIGRGTTVERRGMMNITTVRNVRPNFFDALQVAPVEGRLAPGGTDASATASVVISGRLRAALFGEKEPVIGAPLTVDGKSFTVVGVTARYGGIAPLDADVWTFASSGTRLPFKIIRLKDGVTLPEIQRQLDQVAAQFAMAAGEATKDTRFQLIPLPRQFHASRFHYALVGAGLAILIVACTNLANLQLARGLTRAPELAVRSSLGASRRQIVNQLLIESAVLALAALVLAILLAVAGNAILRATIPPNIGEAIVEPQGSWRMVLFASIVAVLCLLSVGLLPALRISRVDLNSLLKGRAGTGAHRSNRRIYGLLVVVQIALTLPLVCAAVLLSRSAVRSADMDFLIHEVYGYDPRPLIVSYVPLRATSPQDSLSLAGISETLVTTARSTLGVANAAIQTIYAGSNDALSVDDEDGAFREVQDPMYGYSLVSAGYFKTMGIPFDQGKDFDEGGHVEPLVVMDRRSADYLWPRSKPVGRLVMFAKVHEHAALNRVVGVVTDELSPEARELRAMMSPNRMGSIYRLITVNDRLRYGAIRVLKLTVRASGDPRSVIEPLSRKLIGFSEKQPYTRLMTDELGIPQRIIATRFIAGIFTVFGVLALALSALGVYAIVAQSVTDRKREVAVRISLGATPRSIVYALLREGNVLVLAGVAIGLYLTKETMGWVGVYLGAVDLYSAWFFGAMCIALFVAMALAALVPAIRATQMDPNQVLRAE